MAGQFDVGWFHNRPTGTRRQDGYWPGAPNGPIFYWDTPRDASPIGINTAVVVNYPPDELVGPGLSPAQEPNASRFNYTGVGGAGSSLAGAVSDGDYLEYQFTTVAGLNPRTFVKRTGFGSWFNESFAYAVRISTSPAFTTYWTVIQGQRVTGVNGYAYRPANTSRAPFLQPATTYYIRAYLYDRTINIDTTGAQANSIAADDFQIGTAVCPLPRVTVSKVSTGGIGTFNFSGDNGFVAQAITTTAPGLAVAAAPQTLGSVNTATTITEAAPAGFTLASINCTGLPSGTPTYTVNGANGGSVLLPAAAMTSRADIHCTFTNSLLVDLSITKTNTYSPAQPLDLPADMVSSGGASQYTLVVTNHSAVAVTGAIVQEQPATRQGLTCPPTATVSCAGSAASACPSAATTLSMLENGYALGTLPAGGTATLTFTCTVN